MRLIIKIVVVFAVVVLLLLGVLSYLQNREGAMTASAILEDVKDAGIRAKDGVMNFLGELGITEKAADLMEKGAAAIKSTPPPDHSPTPGAE